MRGAVKFRHSWRVLKEREIEVAAPLRAWIAQITVSRANADTIVSELPDDAASFILRSTPDGKTLAMFAGPRTRALHYVGRPGPSCVRARLLPGRARLLFGRSMRDLVDQVVPIHEVGDRVGPLADMWDAPDAFAERLVADTAMVPDPHRDLVGRAAELIAGNGIQTSARRLHVSERHLRNLFTDDVGLPPKLFARIQRFRAVLEGDATRSWSQRAIAAGYYDHSHLTAEFRAFTGVPPTVFFNHGAPPNIRCRGPLLPPEPIQPTA